MGLWIGRAENLRGEFPSPIDFVNSGDPCPHLNRGVAVHTVAGDLQRPLPRTSGFQELLFNPSFNLLGLSYIAYCHFLLLREGF